MTSLRGNTVPRQGFPILKLLLHVFHLRIPMTMKQEGTSDHISQRVVNWKLVLASRGLRNAAFYHRNGRSECALLGCNNGRKGKTTVICSVSRRPRCAQFAEPPTCSRFCNDFAERTAVYLRKPQSCCRFSRFLSIMQGLKNSLRIFLSGKRRALSILKNS